MKTPAFQFYPKQWLGDDNVMLMCWAARGMHMHFMCIAWQQTPVCTLPNDDEILQGWAANSLDWELIKPNWEKIKAQVFRAWKLEDDRWVQPGLLSEYKKQQENREKKIRAAEVRWSGGDKPKRPARPRNARAMRTQCPSSSSSSSTSVSKVLQENGEADPTEIIHRTLADIVPNHPKPSPLPWAVSAVEREVASNHLDAKEFCEALKKTHVEHCKIYERELAANPRAFVPLFHKWVSDGYYLHRPSNRDPPVKKPSYAQAVAAGLVTNLEEYERRFHA